MEGRNKRPFDLSITHRCTAQPDPELWSELDALESELVARYCQIDIPVDVMCGEQVLYSTTLRELGQNSTESLIPKGVLFARYVKALMGKP